MKDIYIISELCGQWGGSIRRAEQMILQSKMFGADAVKVQLYDTYRMPGSHREKWEYLNMSLETFLHLKEFSENLNIDFFASAFHKDLYEWTKDCPYAKIASMMLEFNPELCDDIVSSGKKVFCSLGKWDNPGLPFDAGNVEYMHCVPKYPHTDLEALKSMPNEFIYPLTGYSDHSVGIDACCVAVTRGATVIEKHFTINHGLQSETEGAHSCSMDFEQLKSLRNFCDLYLCNVQ